MKSVRSPEALRDAIIKGTRHLIAVGGMSNFSYPKLLAETGIVAPTVYEHFRNKEDLLTACYLEIDAEIGSLIAGVFEDMPPEEEDVSAVVLAYCQKLWDTYWNYLIADSDRTRFYWTFYHTEYYTAANGKKYPIIAFTFTYTATEASGKQQKGTFTDYYYFDA